MELKFNKEYMIKRIEDLNKFKIDNKVKDYLIETINNLLNEDNCEKVSISLQGSEHNKNVMETTYKNLHKEHEKQNIFLENMFSSGKITKADLINRQNKLKKFQEESLNNAQEVLNSYKEWFEKYNNYDVIVINKYSK